MLLHHALIYRDDFAFHRCSLAVAGERFAADSGEGPVVDLNGKMVIPGLIDIHLHGNSGADFCDGSREGLRRIASYLLANGITAFSPASMTLPEDRLRQAMATAAAFRREKPASAARLCGVTLEGPFFNAARKGAQNAAYLKPPDLPLFRRLNQAADNLIRIACVAPELPGALDFIRQAASVCTVSLAHTSANYGEATAAFAAGARHVTHLYNAMPPLAHREPGVIGAAADHPQVTAELIADGIHIHPSVIRATFRLFGADRLVLVSDSMAACGMPDGQYELGGQRVQVGGADVEFDAAGGVGVGIPGKIVIDHRGRGIESQIQRL